MVGTDNQNGALTDDSTNVTLTNGQVPTQINGNINGGISECNLENKQSEQWIDELNESLLGIFKELPESVKVSKKVKSLFD